MCIPLDLKTCSKAGSQAVSHSMESMLWSSSRATFYIRSWCYLFFITSLLSRRCKLWAANLTELRSARHTCWMASTMSWLHWEYENVRMLNTCPYRMPLYSFLSVCSCILYLLFYLSYFCFIARLTWQRKLDSSLYRKLSSLYMLIIRLWRARSFLLILRLIIFVVSALYWKFFLLLPPEMCISYHRIAHACKQTVCWLR